MFQTKSSAELGRLNRMQIVTGAPELVPPTFAVSAQQAAMVRGHFVGGVPTAAKSFLKHLVKR
jgi:hypothetical protein